MIRTFLLLFITASTLSLKAQNCQANFTTIDTLGYIFFVNNSTPGSSGSYYWDFGDGNTSTQYNPSHVYDSTGTYLVCLIAYDSLGNYCDSTCHYIVVTNLLGISNNENPIAQLTLSPNPSDENSALSFYLPQPADVTFNVYDIAGRMIFEISSQHFSAGKQTVQIATNNFSSGVYFIKSIANGQVATSRLIVSHRQ